MLRFHPLLLLPLLLSVAVAPAAGQMETVASPNSRIQVAVTTQGPLTYSVMHDDELLVEASPLGVEKRGVYAMMGRGGGGG